MKNLAITTLILLTTIFNAHTEEDKKQRRVKLGREHQLITTGAKLSGGLISTLAGASNFLILPLADLYTYGELKPLKLGIIERGEHKQILFDRPNPLTQFSYSWGAFQVNPHDDLDAHEVGHSTAVDTMGPLVLGYGLYDYLKRGHSHDSGGSSANVERWADMEADKDPTAVRRYQLGLFTGSQSRLGLALSVVDEADYKSQQPSGDKLHQQKRFEFFKTRLGLVPDCDDCVLPMTGNFDLSNYTTRMTIGEGSFRPFFEGSYKIASIATNPGGGVKADLLTSNNSGGLKYYITPELIAYMTLGIGTRSTFTADEDGDMNFDVLLGITGQGGLIVGDLMELNTGHQEYLGFNSNISRSHVSITRPITESATRSLHIGVEGESETFKMDDKEDPMNIKHLRLIVGGEF